MGYLSYLNTGLYIIEVALLAFLLHRNYLLRKETEEVYRLIREIINSKYIK